MKSYILNLLLVSFLFVGCNKSNDDEESQETILPFTVTSYSPQEGKVDATVTINGNNFSTTISEITVTFNGIEASVISATETEIKTVVPSSLPLGDADIVLKINNETKPVGNFTVSIDDYRYLVVASNINRVYTVGNNSAIIEEYCRIQLESDIYILTNSISNTQNKIYATTNHYLFEENNYLVIYDKSSDQTSQILLEIPSTIQGTIKAITCLEWDNQNSRLIGLISTGDPHYSQEYHIIVIDPESFIVNDLGLIPSEIYAPLGFTFFNSKFYISDFTNGRDLLSIDLSTNEIINYDFGQQKFYRLTRATSENNLFAIRSLNGSGYMPVKINLPSNTFEDLVPTNDYDLTPINGKSFFDANSNQSINIIGNDFEGYSLYKFNEDTEEKIDLEYQFGMDISFFVIGIE